MLAAVGASIAALVVLFPNSGEIEETFSDEPVEVVRTPEQVPLSAGTRRETLETARAFLLTAVRRERVADSYELVAPQLRQGFTRKEWARGDIPVVPYPVEFARFAPDYSYPRLVGWRISVYPRRGSHLRPMLFYMDLTAFGTGKHKRWLVSNFSPGGNSSPLAAGSSPGLDIRQPLPPDKSRVNPLWLLALPVLVVLAIAAAVAFGVRDTLRGARAARRYASGSGSPTRLP